MDKAKKPIVLVCEPTNKEPYKSIEDIAEVRFGKTDSKYEPEELYEPIKDATAVVITSRDNIDRAVMDHAPNLKLVAKGGAIPSPIKVDRQAATEKGIYVTWTPGTTTTSVAEHALALILAMMKRIPQVMSDVKMGVWRNEMPKNVELTGKSVGIIGMGRIGRKLADLLAPFECKIYYMDPFIHGDIGEAKEKDLDFIVENCDVISIHSELNEKTKYMFSEAQFKRMKNSAYILNTSRGGVIDEGALYKALKEKWIAGAALDVFENEPVRSSPLFELDNIVISCHMAGWTQESVDRSCYGSINNITRVIKGEIPVDIANTDIIK